MECKTHAATLKEDSLYMFRMSFAHFLLLLLFVFCVGCVFAVVFALVFFILHVLLCCMSLFLHVLFLYFLLLLQLLLHFRFETASRPPDVCKLWFPCFFFFEISTLAQCLPVVSPTRSFVR